ncbi:amino acid ABC transporter substrate-binding protein [bacterium]|nr:MAG: amino acid ABC transporter substrate-binding protein [bacterium]
MVRRTFASLLIAAFVALGVYGTGAQAAQAAQAPPFIKIGTLYASAGPFAAISMPVHKALQLWEEQVNAQGGIYVKPYGKKIPIKIIAYDDQSSTSTAATLYNQLITQDKVDILVSDSGSVLTSVAVPIAREHKMLLFDQTGTGMNFFTADNPYIVLLSDPISNLWPKNAAEFLTKEGPKLGIKRVALLYSTNDFTGSQATGFRDVFKGSAIDVVYDHGVPTNTSSYTVLIQTIKALNPDAVIELGYPNNDIAFLRDLQGSGTKFKMVFTVYPGLETDLLLKTVGEKGLAYTYTYTPPTAIKYKPDFGMNLDAFKAAWVKKYKDTTDFGFNAVAGYVTALVLEKTLATTDTMDQMALRKAVFALSGKLRTLDGTFMLRSDGAQIGELTPLGQIVPSGNGEVKFVILYPPEAANGKAVYPAP